MNNTNFMERIETLTQSNLIFPYHIKHESLTGKRYYNPNYADEYHEHSFEGVLHVIDEEPNAFNLTKEDREYYSKQELGLIDRLLAEHLAHAETKDEASPSLEEMIPLIIAKVREIAKYNPDLKMTVKRDASVSLIENKETGRWEIDDIQFRDYDIVRISKTAITYVPYNKDSKTLFTYSGWNELLEL